LKTLKKKHDNYISALQKMLNTSAVTKAPEFGHAFVFELHKNATGNNYFVRVLEKTNKYPAAIKMETRTVYGCDEPCPLEKFLELTKDKVVVDFDKACRVENSKI
jgi:hypothetical protein